MLAITNTNSKTSCQSEEDSVSIPLSDAQLAKLEQLETVIQSNMLSSCKLAVALNQIRSEKLYSHYDASFEDYCEVRWGYSLSYCHRLAKMGEVLEDLKGFEKGDVYPQLEGQARIYSNLNSEQRVQLATTIQKNSDDDHITAEVILRYKSQLFPSKCKKTSDGGKKDTPKVGAAIVNPTPPITPIVQEAERLLKAVAKEGKHATTLKEELLKFIKVAQPLLEWEKK